MGSLGSGGVSLGVGGTGGGLISAGVGGGADSATTASTTPASTTAEGSSSTITQSPSLSSSSDVTFTTTNSNGEPLIGVSLGSGGVSLGVGAPAEVLYPQVSARDQQLIPEAFLARLPAQLDQRRQRLPRLHPLAALLPRQLPQPLA